MSLIVYAPISENLQTYNTVEMKKRSEETQTLGAGCSTVEPKNFARRRPPSRGRGTAKI